MKFEIENFNFPNGKNVMKRGKLVLILRDKLNSGYNPRPEVEVWVECQRPQDDFQDITVKEFISELKDVHETGKELAKELAKIIQEGE